MAERICSLMCADSTSLTANCVRFLFMPKSACTVNLTTSNGKKWNGVDLKINPPGGRYGLSLHEVKLLRLEMTQLGDR